MLTLRQLKEEGSDGHKTGQGSRGHGPRRARRGTEAARRGIAGGSGQRTRHAGLDLYRRGPRLRVDLAQLCRDAAEQFTAIKVDAGAMAAELDRTGRQLQNSLAGEDAKKSMSSTKELRDRFYTLTLEPIHDLRAFAEFAFRKDKGNRSRRLSRRGGRFQICCWEGDARRC